MLTNEPTSSGNRPHTQGSGYLRCVALVVACLGLISTACGSETSTAVLAETAAAETTAAPTTTEPEPAGPQIDFPVTLSGRTLGLDKLTPIEGGQLVDISGIMTVNGVARAQATYQLIDLRVEGTTTTCNDETHEGFTSEHDVKSEGTIEIAEWGTIEVSFDQTWSYFPTDASPPTCDEQIGTWVGVEGVPEGMSGTFHRLRVDTLESLVLTPA